MAPKKDNGIPCFFSQTGVGNIVMRLKRPDTGAGCGLTLHQIVSMEVPIATIPNFDPEAFKKFYGGAGSARAAMYTRTITHREHEESFLKYGPGM